MSGRETLGKGRQIVHQVRGEATRAREGLPTTFVRPSIVVGDRAVFANA
jgi:hypothetical protein